MEQLKINGKDYPVEFSVYFTSEFEYDTGITLGEVERLPESKSTKAVLKMIWWALKDGARKNKKELGFDYYDLCDCIQDDNEIVTQFTSILKLRGEGKKSKATSKS